MGPGFNWLGIILLSGEGEGHISNGKHLTLHFKDSNTCYMCYYGPCLTIALQEKEGEGIHCSNQTSLPQWDPGEEGKRGGGKEGRRGGRKGGTTTLVLCLVGACNS